LVGFIFGLELKFGVGKIATAGDLENQNAKKTPAMLIQKMEMKKGRNGRVVCVNVWVISWSEVLRSRDVF
jgi:hypothetical protein